MRRQPDGTPIERATSNDLMMLAMDRRAAVPAHVAAILLLDSDLPFDLDRAEGEITAWADTVPRLRQRLRRLAPGLGRSIWVDDPDFGPTRHIRRRRCPQPGDEKALLELAAVIICRPLSLDRPLWSADIITGLADHRAAILLVLHHVIADGVGALDILGRLASPPGKSVDRYLPRPSPSRRRLAAEAWGSRLSAIARLPRLLGAVPGSLRAIGGLRPPVAAACSLLQRSGPRRSLVVARIDVDALHTAAGRLGCTVNDAILAATTGALRAVLAGRGEAIDTYRVTILVARGGGSRRATPGNDAAPVVVSIPATGADCDRLTQISANVRAVRATANGASLAALSGPAFRALAGWGGYHHYLNHQRRFHTLISTVRGPGSALTFAGATVSGIIPLSVGEAGNVTITFVALSYAGMLTITAVGATDRVPDLAALGQELHRELTSLVAG